VKNRWVPILVVVALSAGTWVMRPVAEAVAKAMRAKVVNTVKVKESGALVKKIFDTQMSPGSRHGANANLKGYKTVRVAVHQTTESGSSSGNPVQTNFSCTSTVQNRLGGDIEFGQGGEGGVTAGNNTLEVDEPPSMTNRSHIYVGEFAALRPQLGLDLCNSSNAPINVEVVYIYAFRN